MKKMKEFFSFFMDKNKVKWKDEEKYGMERKKI